MRAIGRSERRCRVERLSPDPGAGESVLRTALH